MRLRATPGRIRLLALLLAPLLVLAACGGDDSDGGEEATPETTAAPTDGSATADDGGDLQTALCDPPEGPIAAAFEAPDTIEFVDAGGRYRCQYLDGAGVPFVEVAYTEGLDVLTDNAVDDPDRYEDLGDGIYAELDGYQLHAAHRAGGTVSVTQSLDRDPVGQDLLLAIGVVAVEAAESYGASVGIELAAPDLSAIGGSADDDDGPSGGDVPDIDYDTVCDELDPQVFTDVLGREITGFEGDRGPVEGASIQCQFTGPGASGPFVDYVELDFGSGAFVFEWDERPKDGEVAFEGLSTEAFLAEGQDREPESSLFVRAAADSDAGVIIVVDTYDEDASARTELDDGQWRALATHAVTTLRGILDI